MKINSSKALLLLFILSVGIVIVTRAFIDNRGKYVNNKEREAAVRLTEEWFDLINKMKIEKGLQKSEYSDLKYWGLLGTEYTAITTTLGNFEAKQTAANPEFAGVIIKWLKELKIDSNSVVAINLSGSFPSLAIAALAAVQTLGSKVVMISSLGASMYGANEEDATWIDMEEYLRKYGGLVYKSVLITPGGVNDNGGGLQDEGIESLIKGAMRNKREIYFAKDLNDAVNKRFEIFSREKIGVLINIGGNHAALGNCSHSTIIPNGLLKSYESCSHTDKGLIQRIAENKIPVIHLLNIKDLAIKVGLRLTPTKRFR